MNILSYYYLCEICIALDAFYPCVDPCEIDIKKSAPQACFPGIYSTIMWLIQTKFAQQQFNLLLDFVL